MNSEKLDWAVTVAAHAAAGEIQREIADTGSQHVSEADLRRAVRAGAQAQLGPVVAAEVPTPSTSAWTGRLGALDVGVWHGEDLIGGIEVKWCRQPGKLSEALWDALKLVPQTIDDGRLLGAYLIYGAHESTWENAEDLPTELFEATEHDISKLLERYDKHWRWLLTGAKTPRPVDMRSSFTTSLLANLPILDPRAEQWRLKCVRVEARPAPTLFFEDGLIAKDQPAFGPPAPASRYVDIEDDIQIDPATLPENADLRRLLKDKP